MLLSKRYELKATLEFDDVDFEKAYQMEIEQDLTNENAVFSKINLVNAIFTLIICLIAYIVDYELNILPLISATYLSSESEFNISRLIFAPIAK